MIKLQRIENMIKLSEDEFIYKFYQAFKYPSKHKDLNIIITNKRFIMLSINHNNLTQFKIEEFPLTSINQFMIEYGTIISKRKMVLFFSTLTLAVISLALLIYTFFNFSLFWFLFSIITLAIYICTLIFAYKTRNKQIFFFEIFNKFQNQKIVSITSKHYISTFPKKNYFLASEDTFIMLNEISVIIDQAKRMKQKPKLKLELNQEEEKVKPEATEVLELAT